MSWSLFWKSLVFWIVVLCVLAFATALVPGADRWPEAVYVAIILVIGLGYTLYLKRQRLENPETYKMSPRARRNYWIAGVAFSAFFAALNSLTLPNDAWRAWITLLWSVAALISASRLFYEWRHPSKETR